MSAPTTERRVAVTFDDLPWVGPEAEDSVDAWTDRLLGSLIGWRAPAVGFVVGGKLTTHTTLRTQRLARWRAAGVELGNHTFSHPSTNALPLAAYQMDIVRGERAIRALSRTVSPPRYFRHPYLHTGPDTAYRNALDRFLRNRGYRTAAATIVPRDWVYGRAWAIAHRQGEGAPVRTVPQAYLAHVAAMTAFVEDFSRELLGYEPPQVLLLHVNRLNAHHLGAVLTLFHQRGYRFVTLEEALRDPAYALPVGIDLGDTVSWVQRWATGMGRSSPPAPYEERSVGALTALP